MAEPGSPNRLLSIVVPAYNEEETLAVFLESVPRVLDRLPFAWEIVAVNDGSRDRTLERLLEYGKGEPRLKVVDLSRNFGKEAALTAGLSCASGDAIILMDIDLQDPPELIGTMLEKWQAGAEVVYCRRMNRESDTWLKRTTARAFYDIYNSISAVKIPHNVGDFRLMDRVVVDALLAAPERVRFMKGLFAWAGFRSDTVEYARPLRSGGASKFNYWQLWNLALDGFTSFSTVPLRIMSYLGASVAFVAFLFASVLIVRTLFLGIDVPGYASTLAAILFLGGVQLIGIGILGEYIGRIYIESKQRPIFVIRKIYKESSPHTIASGILVQARNEQ